MASFSIEIEKASGTFGLTPALHFIARDSGGQPASGAPDELALLGTDGCGVPQVPLVGGPVVQGNIVVSP